MAYRPSGLPATPWLGNGLNSFFQYGTGKRWRRRQRRLQDPDPLKRKRRRKHRAGVSVWQRGTPPPAWDSVLSLIIKKISYNLNIVDRNSVARVSRSLDQAMGGKEGWESRKVENAAAAAAAVAAAVAKRKQTAIDRKRAARESRHRRRRKERVKLAAGVIDYRLNVGRVGIKTVARRQNIYAIRLKRLYNRLQNERFFEQLDWEEHVLTCSEFSASTCSSYDSDLDGGGDGEEVQQAVA